MQVSGDDLAAANISSDVKRGGNLFRPRSVSMSVTWHFGLLELTTWLTLISIIVAHSHLGSCSASWHLQTSMS